MTTFIILIIVVYVAGIILRAVVGLMVSRPVHGQAPR
jgi:uncharacterized membrane protein